MNASSTGLGNSVAARESGGATPVNLTGLASELLAGLVP